MCTTAGKKSEKRRPHHEHSVAQQKGLLCVCLRIGQASFIERSTDAVRDYCACSERGDRGVENREPTALRGWGRAG